MITALEVRNFRCFKHQRIEFGKLTILLGPNNSGKSALISALPLLAQTARSYDPSVPLVLDGAFKDFGTYRDLVHQHDARRTVRLRIEVREAGSAGLHDTAASELSVRQRGAGLPLALTDAVLEYPLGHVVCRYSGAGDDGRIMLPGEGRPRALPATVSVMHFLPDPVGIALVASRDRERVPEREVLRWPVRASLVVLNGLRLEFIGGLREPPKRVYPRTGQAPELLGPTGGPGFDLLALNAGRGEGLTARVSEWFRKASIAGGLEVKPLGDRYFEVWVRDAASGVDVNIVDAGYGCSQALPVLIAGLAAPPGREAEQPAFIVEQPELHLHPKAQAELGRFFVDLAKEGRQCIVETHSEHLVVRVMRHVAQGDIAPDDVALYYVWSGEGGEKQVRRIRLTDEATFEDDWPEGFFEEGFEEARQLSLARTQRASRQTQKKAG